MKDSAVGASDPTARYIDDATARLSTLIRQQFTRNVTLVVVSLALFFAFFSAAVFLTRTNPNPSLVDQLEQSGQRLADVAQSLASVQATGADPQRSQQLVEAITAQAVAQRQAVQDLRRTQQSLPPEGLSVLQLLGGSVVLALIGFLGLQRLQNVDSELDALRKFMFEQISARMAEGREVLKSTVDERVAESVKKVSDDINESRSRIETLARSFEQQMSDSAARSTHALEAIQSQVQAMVEEYEWLKLPQARDLADRVKSLVSVEQAHNMASEFARNKDTSTARLALSQIIEASLPGTSDDFFNAQTQAMSMDDPRLALQIVEKGLESFPNQYDLVAGKGLALLNMGRPADALETLSRFRQEFPDEFFRGWRPVVFLKQAAFAGTLTEDVAADLRDTLAEAVRRRPHEIKCWSAYAEFETALGNPDEAEKITRSGLEKNPFSQELNFDLGKALLMKGETEEAVSKLESAFSADFLDQYQHHVNQASIRATLAQAYEASGRVDDAKLLYESLLRLEVEDSADWAIVRYARNRLTAITVARGELPEQSDDGITGQHLLALTRLAAAAQRARGQTIQVAPGVLTGNESSAPESRSVAIPGADDARRLSSAVVEDGEGGD